MTDGGHLSNLRRIVRKQIMHSSDSGAPRVSDTMAKPINQVVICDDY